jgi:quercetin dioxygenase-like cupin family protein
MKPGTISQLTNKEGVMSDSEWLRVAEGPWEPFGGKTKDIFRKSLSRTAFPSGFKASLTLARPGGEFPDHTDPYTHIFYILEGEAVAFVEGQRIPFRKGTALTVPAGKKHGYLNPGPADLLLITLNIYEGGEKK